jgi:hypothetical protein
VVLAVIAASTVLALSATWTGHASEAKAQADKANNLYKVGRYAAALTTDQPSVRGPGVSRVSVWR